MMQEPGRGLQLHRHMKDEEEVLVLCNVYPFAGWWQFSSSIDLSLMEWQSLQPMELADHSYPTHEKQNFITQLKLNGKQRRLVLGQSPCPTNLTCPVVRL